MAESGWASSEEQAWIRFIMAIMDELKVASQERCKSA